MSALPPVLEFLKKNAACAGSYRPNVSTPSPFQSPTSGIHPNPTAPNVEEMSATPTVVGVSQEECDVCRIVKTCRGGAGGQLFIAAHRVRFAQRPCATVQTIGDLGQR